MTSDDQTQRERAAYAAGWLAAREACCLWDAVLPFDVSLNDIDAVRRYVALLRALPPPADAAAALDDVVRVARREAFEEAARVADRVAAQAHTALQEHGIIDAIRRDYLNQRNGARDAAAAIRARAAGGAA